MSNQTWKLSDRPYTTELGELDRELSSENLENINADKSLAIKQPELLDFDPSSVTSDSQAINLFSHRELADNSLYAASSVENGEPNEPEEANPESETPMDGIPSEEIPEEVAEVPLTKTITVGNPEATQFTFNFAEDTPQEVINGVAQAGENWSEVLKDDVDLTFDFRFAPLATVGMPTIGQALPNFVTLPYEEVRAKLVDNATSPEDKTAISNLPEGNVNYLVNNTSENNGSDTPYLDNNGGLNNSSISLTFANAKALGLSFEELAAEKGVSVEEYTNILNAVYGTLVDPNPADAMPLFDSNTNWDFNPDDGITEGMEDFVATVTHEIGHGLGFVSNAELLDSASTKDIGEILAQLDSEAQDLAVGDTGIDIDQFISENFYTPTSLDLFRFSPQSFEQGARDFTTNNVEGKYFSIDGGNTNIAPLAEGFTGNLNLAGLGHWQDDQNIGLMDPTIDPALNQISSNDLLALDVVGWDLN